MVTIGLVVAQYHERITERMEEAARNAATDQGATIAETIHVPGAYDTPLAADRLARREEIDAVAAIGAIITGDTDHDQVIANAAAQGLTDVSLDRDTPVAFGITGPAMTAEEAYDRIDYGASAVESAIDMTQEPPA
ncbi:MAG: 6,7-dimethyl-8-ribityllumazine synthase [Halobacteriales archaeon]|nr:6,7-dimethyl-8-ribityllumazine synthase [Halobacteriales archaeon]